MSAAVGIAWTAYALVSGGMFLLSAVFIRFYQDKHRVEPLATIISIMALGTTLSTVAILPMDVFLVSSTVDSSTGLKKDWADESTIFWMTLTTQAVYYGLYSLIGLFSFFLVPFAYYYYTEYSEDQDDRQHALTALRSTVGFGILAGLLFLVGLFGRPTELPPYIELDWFNHLLNESHGEKAISFVIACVYLVGMAVFVGYTAPGLSILPLNLLNGRTRMDAEHERLAHQLELAREHQCEIQAKYTGENSIKERDDRRLKSLEDEERMLVHRLEELEQDSKALKERVLHFLKPFEAAIGVFVLFVTFIVMISIFIALIDKLIYSICGPQCGYIIGQAGLFHPMNSILEGLQRAFPLDYIFMVGLIVYFLMATMFGVVNIGVRILWVTLYRIRRGATAPQGLLFSSMLLSLGLLALNYSIVSFVAPGYAHFGNQVYCNSVDGELRDCSDQADLIVPCDIYGPTDICTPTVTSTLMDRMLINTPSLSLLYYYTHWAFLAIFVAGFVIGLFRKPSIDNKDNEQEGLLDARHGHHEEEGNHGDHHHGSVRSIGNYGSHQPSRLSQARVPSVSHYSSEEDTQT
ncbi:hypothetical protein BDF14DRAFT_1803582 [Spinellus fusiger]|nr:hypothetical protein BDF14DRAFT_1803582 [Spinellus fusiger]